MDRFPHVTKWMQRPEVIARMAEQDETQRKRLLQNASRRHKERCQKDIGYAIGCNMRNRLRSWAVRRKGQRNQITPSMERLVSMRWDDFRRHLESQFRDGMCWENSSEWQLDHVVPLCRFKLPKELYACFHYTNISPVWTAEHRKKSRWERRHR